MKYGDTSKIVTLYSRKYGKIRVMAKGARASRNKFGASLEPMVHSSVVMYKKEHRDLHLLSKCEIASPFLGLNDDGGKMAIGLAMIELVNMVMHDEEENQPMYALLLESLRAVDESDKNPENIFFAFELKMAEIFGYRLNIQHCARCGRSLLDEQARASAYILLASGSAVCSDCHKERNLGGVKVSNGILQLLSRLSTTPIKSVSEKPISRSMQSELLALLQTYLKYHIEGVRTLRSLSLFTNV
jgi:DNA repair protein RecO (recombination protein O)